MLSGYLKRVLSLIISAVIVINITVTVSADPPDSDQISEGLYIVRSMLNPNKVLSVNGNQPRYMSAGRTDFTLSVSVSGKRATATVTGTYRPLWANLLGANPLQTTATSTAEAATGIGGPV